MARDRPRVIPKHEPPSPLRYPGGKYRLATYVSCVLEENFLTGCTLYETHVGGASVSIELLRRGFVDKAVWVERDPLVFAFWRTVFDETEGLCAAVEALAVNMKTWERLEPLRLVTDPWKSKHSLLSLGLAGLFFNRTNFSGIIGAGPIGGVKQASQYDVACRFNKEKLIAQIRAIGAYRKRVTVRFGDALKFLQRRAEEISAGFSFCYIDPPYYAQGQKLYRYSYEDTDHEALARYITAQGYPWLLSYDDHPRVRELYNAVGMQPLYLDYTVKTTRKAQELLISNLVIPPPVYGVTFEDADAVDEPVVVGAENG
jgi:DNA adenine methylase